MDEQEMPLVRAEPVETEVVRFSPQALSVQREAIRQLMATEMTKGTHFGVIPGCKKPSLWLPGAELIRALGGWGQQLSETDLCTPTEKRYRVRVRFFQGDRIIGEGIGECSSDEEKYAWRKAVCPEEYDATPEEDRREKWKKYGRKPAECIKQVRVNRADVENTVLKMAKKRAFVDCAKSTGACSDLFTQDVEDMPQEYLNQGGKGGGQQRRSSGGSQGEGLQVHKERCANAISFFHSHGMTDDDIKAEFDINWLERIKKDQLELMVTRAQEMKRAEKAGRGAAPSTGEENRPTDAPADPTEGAPPESERGAPSEAREAPTADRRSTVTGAPSEVRVGQDGSEQRVEEDPDWDFLQGE